MPIIDITLVEGRAEEDIDAMMMEIADAVERTIKAPRQTIRIMVRDIPPSRFAIGGRSKAKDALSKAQS